MDDAAMPYTYNDWYTHPDPPHQPLYLASVLRHLRTIRASEVLDAGCGDGNFAASLAAEGFHMFGVDLSTTGIEVAQSRGVGRFARASLYDDLCEPFGVETFDAIVAVETVEHLYSPASFARRAYDALRPGGVLIVTTPYWGYAKNVLLAVTGRMDRNLSALWEGGHIKHWSRSTMEQLLFTAGFIDVRFEGRGRFRPFWRGMVNVATKPRP